MTAKEKSEELINFFRNYTDGTDPKTNRFSPRIERINSAKCSSKVVNEMLSYIKDSNDIKFWNDVQEENNKYIKQLI